MAKLDKEERELLDSVEKGEWISVPDLKNEIKKARESARNTIKRNKRVYIDLSEKELLNIRTKAVEEGLPYQALLSSIIHKYLSGKLVERD